MLAPLAFLPFSSAKVKTRNAWVRCSLSPLTIRKQECEHRWCFPPYTCSWGSLRWGPSATDLVSWQVHLRFPISQGRGQLAWQLARRELLRGDGAATCSNGFTVIIYTVRRSQVEGKTLGVMFSLLTLAHFELLTLKEKASAFCSYPNHRIALSCLLAALSFILTR